MGRFHGFLLLMSCANSDTLLENFRLAKPLDSLMVLLASNDLAHEEVQVNCLKLIHRTVKGHVPSQVGFRVLSGFDVLVRLLASPSAKVREQAAYGLGAACAGQRRMQQAAAKAKGTRCTILFAMLALTFLALQQQSRH